MRNIINHGEWCITLLHVILPTTVFLVNVMLKFHGIKENNPFQLQHFFDKRMLFGCKSIECWPSSASNTLIGENKIHTL